VLKAVLGGEVGRVCWRVFKWPLAKERLIFQGVKMEASFIFWVPGRALHCNALLSFAKGVSLHGLPLRNSGSPTRLTPFMQSPSGHFRCNPWHTLT